MRRDTLGLALLGGWPEHHSWGSSGLHKPRSPLLNTRTGGLLTVFSAPAN